MKPKANQILLALGKIMARATSDFAESESLLSKFGKTGKRSVSQKSGIRACRTVDVATLASEGWTKQKVADASKASKLLNAFDVIAEEAGFSAEELEAVRLEILASEKAPAPAAAAKAKP